MPRMMANGMIATKNQFIMLFLLPGVVLSYLSFFKCKKVQKLFLFIEVATLSFAEGCAGKRGGYMGI